MSVPRGVCLGTEALLVGGWHPIKLLGPTLAVLEHFLTQIKYFHAQVVLILVEIGGEIFASRGPPENLQLRPRSVTTGVFLDKEVI